MNCDFQAQLPSWNETIYELYRECRNFENWLILLDCHDQEDRGYFEMLDEMREKGKLQILMSEPPKAVERIEDIPF